MKNRNICYFFVIGILLHNFCLISCTRVNENQNEDAITGIEEIKIPPPNDSLEGGSKTYNQKYLVLNFEKNTQSVLSSIFDLRFINGEYYITDNVFTGIKVFDLEGNYQRQIGSIGQTASQFKKIYSVDYYNDIIYVLAEKGKLIKYDLNGKHLATLSIGLYPPKFKVIDENRYLFFLNGVFNKKIGDYELVSTDSSANIKDQFIAGKRRIS